MDADSGGGGISLVFCGITAVETVRIHVFDSESLFTPAATYLAYER
ncbi:hypothetical protein ACOZ35_02960 [Halorubrum xinjiangense]